MPYAVAWCIIASPVPFGRDGIHQEFDFRDNHKWNCKGGNMAISKEVLEILACPKCKGDIHLNETGDGLICENCKLLYEIKDDIPIMLIDEAKPLE